MKKHGFTLVELLAVIVILAIILAVAVPSITRLTKNVAKNAFLSNAKMVIKSIANQRLTDEKYLPINLSELNVSTENYADAKIFDLKGNIYVELVGQNKWEGLIAYGTYQTMEITEGDKHIFECGQMLGDTRNKKAYETIKIGDQCWMAEDLKYDNGCLEKNWEDTLTPYEACKYDESASYPSYHYQWEVAKEVCPDGWKLPSDDDWKELERGLGRKKIK